MISSTRNRQIVDLRKLSQRKHRRAQGRFAVEGLQLIGMALEAGYIPLDVFYCPDCFSGPAAPDLLARMQALDAATYEISESLMQTLSERDAPQGLIATFPLFVQAMRDFFEDMVEHQRHTGPGEIDSPALILVLDRLQDPGNLGTLIRTADAVAAQAVVLIEPIVDPFDLKTVRGSMGSIFNLPLIGCEHPPEVFEFLGQRGYKITGADGYQGEIPWSQRQKDRPGEGQSTEPVLRGSTALVLGNEARGLSEDLRPYLTHWVRLPLLGLAESLNVAVAGGVLMYQWLQQNQEF